MSIHNFPHYSAQNLGHDRIDPSSLLTPVRPPTKIYDLVVSLGTDYHTFERLLSWVDNYLQQNPQVSCLIQHGHTTPIARGDNVRLIPAAELMGYYATASAVLLQGGPGSIQDARRTGAIPLVVPRRCEFNEVVDNHQVPFADMMQKNGCAIVIESREDLFDKLNLALGNPSLMRSAKPYVASPEISAGQLHNALNDLLTGKTRRREGYVTRFKNAVAAHISGKREMARIDAITPNT